MTILTKPGVIIKKTPLISENHGDEVSINVESPATRTIIKHHTSATTLICFSLSLALLALLGVLVSLQIVEQGHGRTRHSHYQGYCSIPLARDLQLLESRKMALRLKEAEYPPTRTEPDLQVVGVGDDPVMSDVLREMLDINVDDSLERIAVYSDGRAISFMHDFASNMTGIADQDRCFLMELDPEIVLSPELFVVGLQQGEEFDVGMVRSSLRAMLPAVRQLAHLARGMAEKCRDKPVYKLQKEPGVVIRKRSAAARPHDYIQFAGRSVQEIRISNMPELLRHEAARALPPAA